MSKWCSFIDQDVGEISLNLEMVSYFNKSILCNKQPSVFFKGSETDSTYGDFFAIFETEEERDMFYDQLKIKLEVIR